MLADRAEEAARLLCAARSGATGCRTAGGLPAAIRCRRLPDPGCGNSPARRNRRRLEGRRRLGDRAAFCAPIFARMIRPSPASYDAGELRLIGIEGEIAFRLGRDLPPRAAAIRQRRRHRRGDFAPGYRGRRTRVSSRSRARPARNARRQLRKWWARLGYGRSGLEEARSQPHRDPHHRRWRAIRRQQRWRGARPGGGTRGLRQSDAHARGRQSRYLRHDRLVDRVGVHSARRQDQRRFRIARPDRNYLRRVSHSPATRPPSTAERLSRRKPGSIDPAPERWRGGPRLVAGQRCPLLDLVSLAGALALSSWISAACRC